MLTGDHCCFDIRGGLQGWKGGDPDWGKKCCSNKVGTISRYLRSSVIDIFCQQLAIYIIINIIFFFICMGYKFLKWTITRLFLTADEPF